MEYRRRGVCDARGGKPEAVNTEAVTGERVEFRVSPDRYKHWKLSTDGPVATLTMDVDEQGGLVPGYELKLNSYDLGVDIELYDAVQRLRFEHPEVRAVVITSGKPKIFCAGANIRMLAASPHGWKVNFCKFTNETRNGIEDATANSGQTYLAAVNGTASGGGYELALACEHIMLIDDRSSAVSLPELPLLGVLPGTGGLTRVSTSGTCAATWPTTSPPSPRASAARRRCSGAWSTRPCRGPGGTRPSRSGPPSWRPLRPPADATGVALTPLTKTRDDDVISYDHVEARLDRDAGLVDISVNGPQDDPPAGIAEAPDPRRGLLAARGDPRARRPDPGPAHQRARARHLGVPHRGRPGPGARLRRAAPARANADDWFANEILHYLKRTLQRLDVTSRSLIAAIEPGSCFAGSLLELALAADRSFQLDGVFEDHDPDAEPADHHPRRHQPRPAADGQRADPAADPVLGRRGRLDAAAKRNNEALQAEDAAELGLVTFAPDDIDWDDEIRITIEERASFSPDALTGLEANYRFAGPETMETKIFGRLTAWQNWIFNRPNAVGPDGALRRFGTGQRAVFDRKRV